MYSSLPMTGSECKRARIDLSALKENYRKLTMRIGERDAHVRPIAVVKADAYGHGAPACTEALLACGCDFFAVSCIEEALAVRKVCREAGKHADVLILGYTDPAQAKTLADEELTQTILSPAYAEELARAAKNADVCIKTHVAVDTGMNRIGFCAHNDCEIAQAAADIAALANEPNLVVTGMFTHFATADSDTEAAKTLTRAQNTRYRALKELLDARGVAIPFHHVCNSAAALCAAETGAPALFDGVRLGILLYGGARHLHGTLALSPVMKLQADVIHVHTLLAGETLGYGATYKADRDRTVAVLPIGYADGFLRAYSGAAVTLQTARGRFRVPVIGRVCMDQTFIDVSGTDARVGDTVTLFGDSPEQLALLASRADTIDYECLSLISARVVRICENT
ncbi:MAG: alanine racemase [Clostridia bacterium]|nr:alanine racemase [Clostridia bacterium]MBQ9785799.1 alanine racemase [Clostridia bacterium]